MIQMKFQCEFLVTAVNYSVVTQKDHKIPIQNLIMRFPNASFCPPQSVLVDFLRCTDPMKSPALGRGVSYNHHASTSTQHTPRINALIECCWSTLGGLPPPCSHWSFLASLPQSRSTALLRYSVVINALHGQRRSSVEVLQLPSFIRCCPDEPFSLFPVTLR